MKAKKIRDKRVIYRKENKRQDKARQEEKKKVGKEWDDKVVKVCRVG